MNTPSYNVRAVLPNGMVGHFRDLVSLGAFMDRYKVRQLLEPATVKTKTGIQRVQPSKKEITNAEGQKVQGAWAWIWQTVSA